MADVLLPTWLKCAKVGFRYLDSTGVSRPEFSGIIRTGSRGGDRLAAALEFTPTATSAAESAQERRALLAFLVRLQGRQNRAYLTNPARRLAGSFPTGELLSNNTFASGTTGWAVGGAQYALSVHDHVARFTRTAVSASQDILVPSGAATVVQYAPYAARVMEINGRGTFASIGVQLGTTSGGQEIAQSVASGGGLKTVVGVAPGTSLWFGLVDAVASGLIAGDYYESPYVSLSRCALVDNGPNLLLQSQDLFTTWTQTELSAPTANNTDVAPDGTTSAETIAENTANAEHFLAQSVTVASATEDFTFSCFFKQSSRTWAYLRLVESTGGTTVFAFINLSTGAIGTTGAGANWANLRTAVVSYGNNWHRLILTARKTSAATTLTGRLGISSGDNVFSYTGASLAIAAWGASLAQSGVPVRYVATTTTAIASGTAQTGRAMYVKGLPASTNGLLLPGDEFEVITSYGSELKIVTAPLNSDASELGYLQFNQPLRGTPADNAAVIVHEPMGRFVFTGDLVGWDHEPGIVTRASAEFEEAA